MRTFLKLLVGLLLAPFVLYIFLQVSLRLLGYQFAKSPEDLADDMVKNGKPVEFCLRYITLDFWFRPTTRELRQRCVYRYAEIIENPKICEILLPTEYALACLSNIGSKLFAGLPCTGSLGRNEIHCNEKYSESELLIKNPQIQDCLKYERADVREWCHYTRTLRMPDIYECDVIEHPVMKDDCEYIYALKRKDFSHCSFVQDPRRREYCEIRVNIWLQYPQLRGSSYFGVLRQ